MPIVRSFPDLLVDVDSDSCAKADEMFKAAVPQLEKAHDLAPEDVTTLKILKNIYIQIDDTEKFKEANDKLKALGQ